MKPVLQRLTCLGMALLVLLTSTGLTTYEHACRIHGTRLSLSAPQKCCRTQASEPVSTPTVKRSACCHISAQHQQVPVAPVPYAGHFVLTPVVAILPEVRVPVPVATGYSVTQPVRFQHSPAPPLAGRDRLVFIQSFLI